jgi:Protein of unknown function (DUF2877)
MPIETKPSVGLRAASIGPALEGLCGEGRIHSVFRGALNVRIDGSDLLAVLTGPMSLSLPCAIVLREERDFRTWGLERGDFVSLSPSRLVLGSPTPTVVGLEGAVRERRREFPSLGRPGSAYYLCLESLDRTQADKECELRMSSLFRDSRGASDSGAARVAAPGCIGGKLEEAARRLGAAALALGAEGGPSSKDELAEATASLVGLGQGLTPSGDDLLCGFLAATRCTGRDALQGALSEAIEARLASTNEVSASMLRCAMRGYFPPALVGTAEAIGSGDGEGAARDLSLVCSLGHSSGADMATGFLYGLGILTGALSIGEFAPPRAATRRRYYASKIPLCEAEG